MTNILNFPFENPVHSASDVDPTKFKGGMRRLASGVSVVTTLGQFGPVGMLSTSVTSVSADPPALLVCVNKSTSSHEAFAASKLFCVNVLEDADHIVATRFGSPDFRHTRFQDRDWKKLSTGAPVLVGCSVSFDCEVAAQIEVATHTIFLGRVVAVETWTERNSPLLYWNGEYHNNATQVVSPGTVASGKTDPAKQPSR